MAVGLALGVAPLLASPTAMAAASVDPLELQGLELADGRMALVPRPPVWGQAAADRVAAERRLAGLRRELGAAWVSWDDARQAPAGIITSGIAAPGAVASPTVAEAYARAWLARHHELLAPGSSPDDFVLVGNAESSGIRSVGFAQVLDGRPVLGGQISLHFRADSLAYVASTARPRVRVTPGATVDPSVAIERARAWIDADFSPARLTVDPTLETVVLPLWSGTAWSYHEVLRVDLRAEAPLGRWAVYLDARSGEPVAREQRIRSAATVRFDVPVRWPAAARTDAVAPELYVVEGGVPTTTDLTGEVGLAASPTSLTLTVGGPRVAVSNSAGVEAAVNLPVTDGGTVVWSAPGNEFVDAQLSAFVHASRAKAFVRNLDPGLSWLDGTIDVTVNIGGSCNAGSDGDSVYFLQSDGSCNNTARLADVVYHEVGHSVHNQSIIPGVGAFDSALSEGISDFLASTMVDDSGMGRGFFHSDDPLRELNPMGSEWTWPDDIGEVHATGRIIGGTLWDLRTALMGTLGEQPGREHVDQLWYESIRRAVDIPSMYPQALLFDDDDGNIANGTPNGCEINAAFEAHGLLDPTALGEASIEHLQVEGGRQIRLLTNIPVFPGCPVDLDSAELHWRLRETPDEVTTVPMVQDGGAWVATIPAQATGVVAEYQVTMSYSNGLDSQLPDNAADPWYQTFFGAVVPIYCLDDEADLGAWNFSGPGSDWSFGPLDGVLSVDPGEPYDADGVLLSQDGEYSSGSNTTATGPVIDVGGFDDVRLHYRRWLTVEDGFYDQATIYANDVPIWQNLETEIHSVHHTDREWRFHDLPLDDFVVDDTVELAFGLRSDGGLEFGGWTVDALCVVQVVEAVCGDGQITGAEECDDGNLEEGDGCDAECGLEEPPGETGDPETGGLDESGTSGSPDGTTGGSLPPGGTADEEGTGTGDTEGSGEASDGGGCGCVSGRGRGVGWEPLLLLAPWVRRRRRRRAV